MNWIKKVAIKFAVNQLDGLKPIIAERIRLAQASLASVPPDAFADMLIEDLETAILTKLGIMEDK